MKILDQNPKEYFDKIVDTKPESRPWLLSVLLNIFFAAAGITSFFVFSARENIANNEKIEAERKLDICRDNLLKENKDFTILVNHIKAERDLYWQSKFDNLQNSYNKDLKERADKLEKQIIIINKKVGR